MANADIHETTNRLTATITALTRVLHEEVDNLYTGKNEELATYYKDKTRLLADYAAGLSALRVATQGGKIDLPAEANASLKQSSTELARAMERNLSALAVAQQASQHVVSAIIDAVKQQRQSGAAYGVDKDGHMTAAEAAAGAAQAVTLDTRL
jgi:flagellar biosynthesis/type III secretory pathway chaperone